MKPGKKHHPSVADPGEDLRSYFEKTGYFYYFLTDSAGRFLYINPLFRKKFPVIAAHSDGGYLSETMPEQDYQKCTDAMNRLLEGSRGAEVVDLRLSGSGESNSWTRWELSMVPDEQQETQAIQFIGVDITEEENRFRIVSDTAPVMIWMSDEKNNTTYVNQPWVDFTGVRGEDLDESGWKGVVHPDDLQTGVEQFNQAFYRKQPVNMVYRLRTRSGAFRWVLDKGIPRTTKDGTFLGYTGSVVDIHEQKLKEDALRYQATILENVSDSIITCGEDSRVITWNRKAEAFYGVSEKEAIGKYITDLVNVSYLNTTREEAHRVLDEQGTWRGEVAYVNQKGERHYLLNTLSYLVDDNGQRIGILAIGKDITDHKLAEERLMQSEEFFRNLINHSIDGILLTDVHGVINFSSSSMERILGHTEQELIGRNTFEFVHPDDFLEAREAFRKEIIEQPEVKQILVRVRRKRGDWVWCMVRGHNLLGNHSVGQMAIYVYDDSLRKQAEDAVKESEERFRNLIRDLQLGVVLQDRDARMIHCNRAALDLLGLTEDQLLGRTSFDPSWNVIHEDGKSFPGVQHPVPIAISTRRPVHNVVMGIYRPTQKDRVWLLVNAVPILNEKKEVIHVISSFADITLRKKLEKQVIEQEIGKQKYITQAIIDAQEKERREIGKELHDNFGQQLTTLKLYLDLAADQTSGKTSAIIDQSRKHVMALINEIRMLSRSLVPPTLGDLGLVDSVRELTESITRVQPFEIDFDHAAFSETGLAENVKLMIFRIIQEQLNNIIKYASASRVAIQLSNHDGRLQLKIADDGKGFHPEQIKKGVGFNSIANRAGLFNGEVEIYSLPGKGCSVNVVI